MMVVGDVDNAGYLLLFPSLEVCCRCHLSVHKGEVMWWCCLLGGAHA